MTELELAGVLLGLAWFVNHEMTGWVEDKSELWRPHGLSAVVLVTALMAYYSLIAFAVVLALVGVL